MQKFFARHLTSLSNIDLLPHDNGAGVLTAILLSTAFFLLPARALAQSAPVDFQAPAASAQSATAPVQSATPQNSTSTANTETTKPEAAKQPVRLKTSVDVNVVGTAENAYSPTVINVGISGNQSLIDTPASVTAVTRQLLDDQQSKILSDVVKNDASIGENYAPVGYYGDYAIRGFVLDLATALKIDNMTIAGEQDVALENKDRVEFLKGLTGLENGVAAPGGLINYVTKRPELVHSFTLGTDALGSSYGATDLGTLFGSRKQFGLRINVAGENIHSYVNHADGTREFVSAAADWHVNERSVLKTNFEYQHKVQGSVSGYQLLGGTTLPTGVSASTMIGWQWWAKPNTFDTYNTSARYETRLSKDWQAFAAVSRSQSLIDDNVAYAYGNSVSAPYNYFSTNGDYDVYDYRSPNERRVDEQMETGLFGKVKTAFFTHNISTGYSVFHRLVSLTNSVYDYVGTENINQPLQTFTPSPNEPTDYSRRLNSTQYAFFVNDRIDFAKNWQASVGGRSVVLRNHDYHDSVYNNRTIWLPQYSLIYKPVAHASLYASYSETLSLGVQAPWWSVNGNAYLDPFYTRQIEIGAKYELSSRLNINTAVFRIRTPYQYDMPDGVDSNGVPQFEFVSHGRETHDGVELNVNGRMNSNLNLTESATAISAQASGSGTPGYDNKQLLNTPRFRNSVTLNYAVPELRTLHLLAGWLYTGRKTASPDGLASVPSYSIFNLGLRYSPKFTRGITYGVYSENIFNKFYWKDTGGSYGDAFLHIGAPRSVRLSMNYEF